jgi:hypothetical protein
MKKIITMGIALIMVVAIVGCQNASNVDDGGEDLDLIEDGEVITEGFIMQFEGEYILLP